MRPDLTAAPVTEEVPAVERRHDGIAHQDAVDHGATTFLVEMRDVRSDVIIR